MEAFTRAFNVIRGVAPSLARGISLKAYPRISFLLTVKGVIVMYYRMFTPLRTLKMKKEGQYLKFGKIYVKMAVLESWFNQQMKTGIQNGFKLQNIKF